MATTTPRPLPDRSALARHWMLDPDVVFLNHGSFGGCPREVLGEQARVREEMEREPVRFFVETLPGLVDAARHAVARFVNCRGEDLVFVPNATTGVATALANLEWVLKPGDELLATTHEYPACMNNLRRTARRTGAKVVQADVPFPIRSVSEAVETILGEVTPRTRVALLSHVTAPTALVLPVAHLTHELESRGIAVIIDGAHGPGMVDVDVAAIGASFYTANCHKWMCAPKGAAFLHIREDRQQEAARGENGGFRPLVLSNSAEKPLAGSKHMLKEFDYVGTQDVSSWICVPAVIRFMEGLVEGGWPEVCRRNHELICRARQVICRALDVEPPAPEEMIGSMSTIVLPSHEPERAATLRRRPTRYHDALQDALVDRHRIQVPVWGLLDRPARFVRPSAQLYNSPAQYEYLGEALAEELKRERAL